MNTGNRWNAWQ